MYLLLSISNDGKSGEAVKPEMEKPEESKYDDDIPNEVEWYFKNLAKYESHLATLPRIPVDLTNSKLEVGERFEGYEQVLLSYGQGSTWYNLYQVKDTDAYREQSKGRTLQTRLIPEQPGKGGNQKVVDTIADVMVYGKSTHSQEAPEQGEGKYELGKGLQAKVDFYREQTEKIRTWLDENKIGNPCQGFFDAVLEHLKMQKAVIVGCDKELERLKGLIRELWESKIVFKKRVDIESKWQQFKLNNNL